TTRRPAARASTVIATSTPKPGANGPSWPRSSTSQRSARWPENGSAPRRPASHAGHPADPPARQPHRQPEPARALLGGHVGDGDVGGAGGDGVHEHAEPLGGLPEVGGVPAH